MRDIIDSIRNKATTYLIGEEIKKLPRQDFLHIQLSEKLHPLGITLKGDIYSIAKLRNPCSQEDLDEMVYIENNTLLTCIGLKPYNKCFAVN